MLTELTETEHRIEDGELRHVTESEFICPGGFLYNNWDENDWTKRLHRIK